MITVQPSASFEATAQFDTGATLGVRIIDNAGATTLARQTSGIAEYPAGSGIYAVTLTAPGTAGQYTVLWDDGTNYAPEDMLVTGTAGIAPSTSNLYVTRDELKETLELDDETYADDDIDMAVSAASRAIDGYKNARYYPTSETRYYSADPCRWDISIDDLNSGAATILVDVDGDGVYETTWTGGTDYYLEPANAALTGKPYNRLRIRRQSGRTFPSWQRAIQIQGSFGWAETPDQVRQAAKILAGRYLKRARETPYGILTITGDAVAAARLGRIDPDVAFMLDNIDGDAPRLIA